MSASPTRPDVRPPSKARRPRKPARKRSTLRRGGGPDSGWRTLVKKVALGLGVLAAAIARAASEFADQATAEDLRPTEPVDYIGRDEGFEILNRAAKQNLDMTGDEFIKLWDAGQIERPDRPEVMRVAMLLPLGR